MFAQSEVTDDRFDMNESTMPMFETKHEVLNIFQTMTGYLADSKRIKLLVLFKDSQSKLIQSPVETGSMNMGFSRIFNSTSPFDQGMHSLSSVVVDLLKYDDLSLTCKAFDLLIHQSSQEIEAYRHIKNTFILMTEESVNMYKESQQNVLQLRSRMEMKDSQDEDFIINCIGLMSATLKTAFAGEKTVSLEDTQQILRSANAHLVCCRFLGRLTRDVLDESERSRNILKAIYEFLTLFVRGNTLNQESVVEHMAEFYGHVYLGQEPVEFLQAMFKDNRILCNTLSGEVIDELSKYLIQDDKFSPQFLTLFSYMATPKNRTLKHVQEKLLELFEDNQNLLRLYTGDRERKAEAIAAGDYNDPNSELCYHAELMGTLTAICTGLNVTTEVKLQRWMPLDQVLLHIGDPEAGTVKKSMVDFFVSAYLEIEREVHVFDSDHLWNALFVLSDDIANLSDAPDATECDMINSSARMMSTLCEKFSEEFINGGRKNHNREGEDGSGDVGVLGEFVECISKYFNVEEVHFALFDLLHVVAVANLSEKITAMCEEVSKKLNLSMNKTEATKRGRATDGDVKTTRTRNDSKIISSKDGFCASLMMYITGGRSDEANEGEEDEEITNEFTRLASLFLATDTDIEETGKDTDMMVRKLIMCIGGVGGGGSKVPARQIRTHLKILKSLALLEDDDGSKAMNQNRMHRLGCTQMVVDMISSCTEHDVLDDVLKCGIALFEDGNVDIQAWLHTYFLGDSQAFFRACRYLLVLSQKEVVDVSAWWSRFDDVRLQHGVGTDRNLVKQMLPPLSEEACIKGLLRFLQIICENHYKPVQLYLREQEDNIQSFDLVMYCAKYLFLLDSFGINEYNVDRADQALNTLIEFCQGPIPEHQKMLASAKYPSVLNRILEYDINNYLERKQEMTEAEQDDFVGAMYRLKATAADALLALLEGCTNNHVPTHLSDNVSIKTLESILVNGYNALMDQEATYLSGIWGFFNSLGRDLDIDGCDACLMAFQTYFVVLTMAEHSPKMQKVLADWKLSMGEIRYVMDFYDSHTGDLEICGKDGKLQKLYYRIPDVCYHLSKKTKQMIMWSVDRSSPAKRVDDFQLWFDTIYTEMKQLDMLENHYFHAFFELREYDTGITWMILAVALIINLLMLLLLMLEDKDLTDTAVDLHNAIFAGETTVKWEAIIDCWQSRCMGEMYFSQTRPGDDPVCTALIAGYSNCETWWMDMGFGSAGVRYPDGLKTVTYALGGIECMLCLVNCILFFAKYGKLYTKIGIDNSAGTLAGQLIYNKNTRNLKGVARWRVFLATTLVVLSRIEFIIPLVGLTAAVAGLVVSPFFYCYHLFTIIQLSPDLQNVINALVKNGRSVLLTFGLGLILVYMYGVLGYEYFREHYVVHGDSVLCYELVQCTAVTLSGGLRKNDVGEYMSDTEYTGEWQSIPITIFLFSFYFIILNIGLNIIFGIIIDTFGELRSIRAAKMYDINNFCFICGIDANTFERFGSGFSQHTNTAHDMWEYSFFYVHLKKKRPSDYTGPELFVARCIAEDSTEWFPLNMSLELQEMLAKQEEEGVKMKQGAKELASSAETFLNETTAINKLVEETKMDIDAVFHHHKSQWDAWITNQGKTFG